MSRFYATIPSAQKEFLKAFEESHSQKSLCVDGVTWNYYDSEMEGRQGLLLLHGGYAGFDMWMHQIVEFEKEYRIIAPTCPVLPHATMKAYSDALGAILKAENVQVSVMGYSEGGLIAQCFLRDHSAIVDKVILAHTFYPSREASYYRHNFTLFRILPSFLTESIFRLLAKPDKEELQHDSTEWLEWFKGYFKELKSRLTKGVVITHIDLMTDFVRNYSFHPDDLTAWKGRMLITVAEDDIVLKYFDGMKKLYPKAECHVFEKELGAHSLALISPQVFNRRIREFLEN